MKQPVIFLITTLYLWIVVALGNDQTDYKQHFSRKQKTARRICLDTGGRTGKQTVEVLKQMVGFFTSNRRTNPAKVQ